MPMSDTVFDSSQFNLKNMGLVAAPADPFVVCVHNQKVIFKTKTITDDLNPVWNHKSDIEIDPKLGPLQFIVFDEDTNDTLEKVLQRSGDDDYIGMCTVELKSTPNEGQEFDLQFSPDQKKEQTKTGKKKQVKRKMSSQQCTLTVKIK